MGTAKASIALGEYQFVLGSSGHQRVGSEWTNQCLVNVAGLGENNAAVDVENHLASGDELNQLGQ